MFATSTARSLRLRQASEADVQALAEIRVATWHAAYRGILPDHELARVDVASSRRAFERHRSRPGHALWMAEDRRLGTPLGYTLVGPQLDPRLREFRGEVFELYVAPEYHGEGIGRQLLAAGLWQLVDRGQNPSLVWVLSQNRAQHFYAACGGELIARDTVEFGGYRGYRCAYGWAEVLPLPP